MRVLYLTNNTTGVSTNATLQGWLQLLRTRGLDPVVVTHDVDGPLITWLREKCIPAYRLPMPRPEKRWPFPFLRCLWRLRRIVRRHRCQLIHCNEHDIYPIAQPLARVCGLPIIVGARFTMERGFCEYAFAGRRCPDRMFFVSRGNLEACQPGLEGVVPETIWRVLYNGTDLGRFRPDPSAGQQFRAKHGLPGGLLIGAASALRPVKQLEHLFDAAARLRDPTVRVVLAGGPVPEYQEYAVQVIARGRQRLGDRLIHLGHVAEMPEFFNAIDLFVSTSQAEGCSNSVLQALACGVPVIGYPSVSVDEQVLPDGGAIVPQNCVDGLTAELNRWLSDARLREAGRRGARGRAVELFDVRKSADLIWQEYRELVGSAAASSTRSPQTIGAR
jgi:glycosyltransferase involved in cell wall biosynthesis